MYGQLRIFQNLLQNRMIQKCEALASHQQSNKLLNIAEADIVRQDIHAEMTHIDDVLKRLESIKSLRNLLKFRNYRLQQQDEQRSRALIWKYDPIYDYAFEPYDREPSQIQNQRQLAQLTIETRNNWIVWLDRPDTTVCSVKNGVKIVIDSQTNGIIQFRNMQQGTLRSIKSIHTLGEQQISLAQFHELNNTVQVVFTNHRYIYNFANCLIKLQVQEDEMKTIILNIRHQTHSVSSQIRRVLIFRLEEVQEQEEDLLSSKGLLKQLFCIVDGYYEAKDFVQAVDLRAGCYIIMPSMETNLTVLTSEKLNFDFVQPADRKQIKELNLMLQGFSECHPQNMNSQFMRKCDLSTGILIEVYRNMYDNVISFQNVNNKNKEDKKLMFSELYSKRYQSYRLRRGETIVEFYQITSKPAILYQPQKRIIVDKDEDHEAQTVHSILK